MSRQLGMNEQPPRTGSYSSRLAVKGCALNQRCGGHRTAFISHTLLSLCVLNSRVVLSSLIRIKGLTTRIVNHDCHWEDARTDMCLHDVLLFMCVLFLRCTKSEEKSLGVGLHTFFIRVFGMNNFLSISLS